MKGKLFFVFLVIVFVFLFIPICSTGLDGKFTGTRLTPFTVSLSPSAYDSGLFNVTLNFSLETSENVSVFNISLPQEIVFINNSNMTSEENTVFVFYGAENTVSWINSSTQGFLSSTGWFTINVNLPIKHQITSLRFNVTVEYLNGTQNYGNDTLTLLPTYWSTSRKFYVTPPGGDFPIKNFNENNYYNVTFYLKTIVPFTNFTVESSSIIYPRSSQEKFYSFNNSIRFDIFINGTSTNSSTTNSTSLIEIIPHLTYPPGLYESSITIYSTQNKSENLTFPIEFQIPISTQNLIKNRRAILKTEFSSNASYFLEVPVNTTFVYLSLNSSKEESVFVYEGNVLKTYFLKDGFYPVEDNISTLQIYSGSQDLHNVSLEISLLPFNISERSELVKTINFSYVLPGHSAIRNLKIENLGNLSYHFQLSSEIFRELKFDNLAANKSISFYVNPWIRKIDAILETASKENFSLLLVSPDNSTANSTSTFVLNNTPIRVEEISFEDPESGLWRLNVINLNGESANVTLRLYVNSSLLNFSSPVFDIGSFESKGLNLTLELPTQFFSGEYKGYVRFLLNASYFELPIYFFSNGSDFVINNKYENPEIYAEDNIGFNRTGTNNITLILNITNVGDVPINLSFYYFPFLNNTAFNTSFMRITNVTIDNESLQPQESTLAYVYVYVYTNETRNKEGIYSGNVIFNASSNYSFSTISVNVKINLSSKLDVNLEAHPTYVKPSRKFTVDVKPFYLNGTLVYYLSSSNFTFSLKEIHTGKEYDLSASSLFFNYFLYELNLTLPSDTLGGTYTLTSVVDHYTSGVKLSGQTLYKHLFVNETGLKFSIVNNFSEEIYVDESTVLYVRITNYGFLASNSSRDIIKLEKNCSSILVYEGPKSCEDSSYSNSVWHLSVPENSSCYVSWKLKGRDKGVCEINISVDGKWFRPFYEAIALIIRNVTVPTPSPEAPEIQSLENKTIEVEFPEVLIVKRNSVNRTFGIVRSIGFDGAVDIEVENVNSSWIKLYPSHFVIGKDDIQNITIEMSVEDEKVGVYNGVFVFSFDGENESISFKLYVWPSDVEIQLINISLKLFENRISNLTEIIKENASLATKLNLTKEKLNLLKESLKKQDFIKAYNLFYEVKAMLEDIESEISQLSPKEVSKGSDIWFYVKISLCAIGILFLLYLFWPEEEVTYKSYWYRKQPFYKRIFELLKERFKKRVVRKI